MGSCQFYNNYIRKKNCRFHFFQNYLETDKQEFLKFNYLSNAEVSVIKEIHVPASSLLGHMALGINKNVSIMILQTESLNNLPIALPIDNKEIENTLISLAPVHHAS